MMMRKITLVAALLALSAGTALAQAPSTTAYFFSSHPMISGTVVSVNDRQMVVNTDQGEQVALEMDSRTLAPRDLAPGLVMRVEFLALEDCRFYAQRVIAVRGGTSTERLQSYANTHDSEEAIALSTSGHRGSRWESRERQASADTPPQTMGEHSPGRMMTATPSTSDYLFSNRPLVTGTVISANDHRVVVTTEQGQKVSLVMDSRTMVPRQIAPGSVIRTEFTKMDDGRYLANRISRIGEHVADREQAYAHTRDSDFAIAENVSDDCGFTRAATPNTETSAVERRETAAPEPVVAENTQAPVAESPTTLPQTASNQPLLLLLGLFALGSAGLVTVVRSLRRI